MKKQRNLSAYGIAFTFVGTVIGAGFASGQEILQFFVRYGPISILGGAMTGGLLIWVSYCLMKKAQEYQMEDPSAVAAMVFGGKAKTMMTSCCIISAFIVAGAMFAGIEALSFEYAGAIPTPNIWVSALLAVVCVAFGLQGIAIASTVIVPFIVLFFSVASCLVLQENGFTQEIQFNLQAITISPFLYVSMNMVMSSVVLMRMGKQSSRRAAKIGTITAGTILGILLMLLTAALLTQGDRNLEVQLPVLLMVSGLGAWARVLYACMVWASIFTTLISSVYYLSDLLHTSKLPMGICAALTCVVGILFGRFGFAKIIIYAYPVMGLLGFLVMALAFAPLRIQKKKEQKNVHLHGRGSLWFRNLGCRRIEKTGVFRQD